MATLAANVPTLVDVAKRTDPDGRIAAVAELLEQANEIIPDVPWKEGNLPTGHQVTLRTALPTPSWRRLNEGVAPTKSRTDQVQEHCGMLEDWSEVDKDVAELNGNTPEFRLSEASAHIEGISQEFASTLFYGNHNVAQEEFTGIAPRYASAASGDTIQNVIDAGGSGSDQTSIWLIVWGEHSIFGTYPKGSKGGLEHFDLGEETSENVNGVTGTRMRVLRDRWVWKAGLVVKDWRFAVRIANIDVPDLDQAGAADITKFMILAIHRVPSLKMGRPVFYANRTIMATLDIQRRDEVSAGGGLTYKDVDGYDIPHFRGIPIKIVDQILNTEAEVV